MRFTSHQTTSPAAMWGDAHRCASVHNDANVNAIKALWCALIWLVWKGLKACNWTQKPKDMYHSLWCSLSLSLFKGKNFKVQLFIYIFHIFVKVFTFNEFYLKNRPSDFKIIYTKKLQFSSLFFGIFSNFLNKFLIFCLPNFVKVFTFNEFYLKNHPSDFKIIYTKKLQFSSLFFGIFSNFLKKFLIFCLPNFVKVLTLYEFYLKNCLSDFKIIYTKKLQFFFSIFWYN